MPQRDLEDLQRQRVSPSYCRAVLFAVQLRQGIDDVRAIPALDRDSTQTHGGPVECVNCQ